jgi:hypothetical protein
MAVWLVALLAMLPWLIALHHVVTLPSEAARQDLTDGRAWPGLLAAQMISGAAVGLAVVGTCLVARRAPQLVVGFLVVLALVMGWVVRPLLWRHAPADVL